MCVCVCVFWNSLCTQLFKLNSINPHFPGLICIHAFFLFFWHVEAIKMGVSSILIGFSIINYPFWGFPPIFGNTQINWCTYLATQMGPLVLIGISALFWGKRRSKIEVIKGFQVHILLIHLLTSRVLMGGSSKNRGGSFPPKWMGENNGKTWKNPIKIHDLGGSPLFWELVGGWTSPFEKYARQNGFIFPK